MITYAQLKSIAEKNGCRIEVSSIYSEPWYNPYDMEEHRTLLGYQVGVNNLYGRKGKSEWQWFWFETLGCYETLEDDTKLTFQHRYSMLTGQTHKGIWEGINASNYIEDNA